MRIAPPLIALLLSSPLTGCGDDGGAGPDAGAAADAGAADAGTDAAGETDGGGDAGLADGGGPDAGPPPCSLTDSEPVEITEAGAVVEELRIDADGVPAITVRADSVVVRDVYVTHRGAAGIVVTGASDVTLERVFVEYLGAPESGPNPSAEHVNVSVYDSPAITVDGARLHRGSSGIYLQQSPGSVLRRIEGEDFRGPFPRGQLVQWNDSDDGLLEDFSVVNPASSWPEDNVNVYQSTGMTIRRGLVDGNNSPSGVGVIFDGGDSTGRVEDVDAVRMGNGCFSSYDGGDGSVFLRTRCRDNICEDQGRGTPGSGGLMWAGKPGLSALRIESSSWFAACAPGNIVWPSDSFEVIEVEEVDFTPREPIAVRLCWE